MYTEKDILAAKLALLENTKMVDLAKEVYQKLNGGAEPPEAWKESRAATVRLPNVDRS